MCEVATFEGNQRKMKLQHVELALCWANVCRTLVLGCRKTKSGLVGYYLHGVMRDVRKSSRRVERTAHDTRRAWLA